MWRNFGQKWLCMDLISENAIQPATCKSDSDQDIHNEFNIFIIGKCVRGKWIQNADYRRLKFHNIFTHA